MSALWFDLAWRFSISVLVLILALDYVRRTRQ